MTFCYNTGGVLYTRLAIHMSSRDVRDTDISRMSVFDIILPVYSYRKFLIPYNPNVLIKYLFLLFIRLDGAKRDNDFIYHEPEPASTALPDIKGVYIIMIIMSFI